MSKPRRIPAKLLTAWRWFLIALFLPVMAVVIAAGAAVCFLFTLLADGDLTTAAEAAAQWARDALSL